MRMKRKKQNCII